ncbi:hypothetical protein JB92DRAFT_3101142 [Gautieria morchelliformis]|nr:hypothetical protein JB92DRAFT_3101142 [Gautieria morchelliformis]
MFLTDFVLCTALHRASGQLTIDQSGSVDDSEKDARMARRRSRSAVSLRRAHVTCQRCINRAKTNLHVSFRSSTAPRHLLRS